MPHQHHLQEIPQDAVPSFSMLKTGNILCHTQCQMRMDSSENSSSFSLLKHMSVNPSKTLQNQENMLNYYCNKKGV